MIVDSSALTEQVVDDVIESAFNSAGQRCSALRVLAIQDEVYDKTISMLVGATKKLKVGVDLDSHVSWILTHFGFPLAPHKSTDMSSSADFIGYIYDVKDAK